MSTITFDQSTDSTVDQSTDSTPPPVKASGNKKHLVIAVAVAAFAVLALTVSLTAVFVSSGHSTATSNAAPAPAPAATPASSFIADLQSSTYWSQLSSADSDATLTAVGQGAVPDIQQGDDEYSLISDATATANDAGVSSDALVYLDGAAVRSFAPQYLPLVNAWLDGNPYATIYTLGIG